MFGLHNFSGSCWVNACLQAIFRIPEVKARYNSDAFDAENPTDVSLSTIWNTKGKNGLKDFFVSVRNATMPAGQGIGDSHELLTYLCDKLPFLDKLCRFKIADKVSCKSCDHFETKEDTVIEFSLHPETKRTPISHSISKAVTPYDISDWKCEKCSNLGCSKQLLIGEFPKVMIYHITSIKASLEYSSVLVLNSRKYYLLSVISFNGGHWWSYSREMPPGKSWYTLDDTSVREHGPNEFPLSDTMRVLIYYQLDE